MAKRVYIGINDVARKVKKMYMGVDGVARAIKKAYIGIGGVARPFWPSLDGVEYYGQITPLSQARYHFRAKTTPDGNHILFGGGADNDTVYATVDAYDKNLTRTLPTALKQARCVLDVATVGDYVVFAGGGNGVYGTTAYTTIDIYNPSLTRTNTISLPQKRCLHAGASIGDYALFAGGSTAPSNGASLSTVERINSSLTRAQLASSKELPGGATNLGSCSTPTHAIFAGGSYGRYVTAYNASLTRTLADDMTAIRSNLKGATVGGYALFAGGYGRLMNDNQGTDYYILDVVDAYNASLTRTTAPALSTKRYNMTEISVPGYAIFCGGAESSISGDTAMYGSIDVYDASLTRTTPQNLTVPRYNMAGDAINGYALFGGGTSINVTDSGSGSQGSAFNQVEAYQFPTE